MDERHLNEQLLGVRVGKAVGFEAPLAAFQEHAIYVATVFRSLFDVFVGHVVLDKIVEVNSVDGDVVLSSIVLQSSRQEGLGEEESREPEFDGRASGKPIFQEIDSVIAILNPRSEGLQRKEPDLGPSRRNLVIEKRICHSI